MSRVSVHGRRYLVTGASSGIGAALARLLASRGATVGVVARRADRLEALASSFAPGRVVPLPADLTDPEEARRVVEAFGKDGLHGVVNNAGASMNARFDEAALSVFHDMMAVNYFASLYVARYARPFLERTGGSLVFVSSVVGKRGMPTRSGYSAAKFAVHALFESLRVEWADTGIHVGIVAPGYVDTDIRQHALGADGQARGDAGFTAGRVMTAEQAAAAIFDTMVRRKREVILTPGGKAMVWLNHFAPHLADRLAARVVR